MAPATAPWWIVSRYSHSRLRLLHFMGAKSVSDIWLGRCLPFAVAESTPRCVLHRPSSSHRGLEIISTDEINWCRDARLGLHTRRPLRGSNDSRRKGSPGEVPTGLPFPDRKVRLFQSFHPGISLGLILWGKMSAIAFLLLGMRTSGASGGGQDRRVLAVSHADGLFPSLCCTCLTETTSLPSALPFAPALSQKGPQSPCSGEFPAGNVPPTLRTLSVEAPRAPSATSKTRV